MGDLFAVVVAVTPLPKQIFDLLHAVLTRGVQLKQFPHHGGLILVDHQPPVVLSVAEDTAVAQHHTVFDGLLVSELHAAGQLAQFVLGDAGHDGQAQLAVLVQGVDVVILEEHPDPGVQQFTGVLDGVQSVTGKTGDLLGDDEVKESGAAVLYHAVEVFALPRGGGRQALVNVALHIGPVGIFSDQAFVVLNLVAQRIELFVALAGHASVKGHSHRNIVDGFRFQQLPNIVDIHKYILSQSSFYHVHYSIVATANQACANIYKNSAVHPNCAEFFSLVLRSF